MLGLPLPMMYEASVVLPYQETNAGKKTFLIDATKPPSDISREDYLHDVVSENYPDAVGSSMRLMRPDEIKSTFSPGELLVRQIGDAAMDYVGFQAALAASTAPW
jgi:hypothetical protein